MLINSIRMSLLVFAFGTTCYGEDWPGWMGKNRDSVVAESGYLKAIPKEGLKTVWRVPLHGGYAGPAVAGGRVFVTDYLVKSGTNTNNPGGRDKLEGTERILCLDEKTGKTLWEHKYERPYNISYATGPRATPTVDKDLVYSLGAEGDLICLSVAEGKVVWSKSLPTVYKSETPLWGHSAHPLIHGDLLYTLAGGEGSVVGRVGQKDWRRKMACTFGQRDRLLRSIYYRVLRPQAIADLDCRCRQRT